MQTPIRWLALVTALAVPLRAGLASEAKPPAAERIPTETGDLLIFPIEHATFVMQWDQKTIVFDPVSGAATFQSFPKPDLILLTDIHGDHFHVPTLNGLVTASTKIVAPAAAVKELPEALRPRAVVLANGEKAELRGISIEAIAMYNTSPERAKYHPKGRGNGYVLTLGGKRIYNSGDTEDIPELRQLKGIDVAFVCMNLPYTMDARQAASAVLEFKPKIVYPFHYRSGGRTKTDLDLFRRTVEQKGETQVRLLRWYP